VTITWISSALNSLHSRNTTLILQQERRRTIWSHQSAIMSRMLQNKTRMTSDLNLGEEIKESMKTGEEATKGQTLAKGTAMSTTVRKKRREQNESVSLASEPKPVCPNRCCPSARMSASDGATITEGSTSSRVTLVGDRPNRGGKRRRGATRRRSAIIT
jgi:hypothetical protein